MTYNLGPILLLIVVLALFFALFFTDWVLDREVAKARRTVNQNKLENNASGSPYRDSAKVDSYETSESKVAPTPPAKPKIKKKVIKMPKTVKVFGYLIPALLANIAMGFMIDSNAFGNGAKVGCGVTVLLINVFFIIAAINRAEQHN